ncbi:solute carrier family 22 member 5-like [Acanthochromis polyacanthus]|uniref:solute carrier family 22 member 5-like n=1 Tax=Acanthochromis polyacanthus TaxID=80966 RepID=UPI0022346D6D|nr:solute carrier family 22 member 5-like [Acanthochromis polyacanthus]XP_051793595.1 solute carrier family 22 member 5-like [Acanthochromis polyacanthus]
MQDYDEATAFLGHWGPFQRSVFFLLSASILPNGFGAFSLVFLTDVPSHHCLVPEVNLTQEWNEAIIPIKVVNGKQELSRCSRYRLDVVRNLSAQGYIPGRDVNLTDLEQEGCVDGWSYSKDIYWSTMVSEFDLVCDEQWKQPFTSTIYFLGVLAGSFISGQVSDRFGRKPVLFATLAIQTIFSFVGVFAPSWTVLSIILFISGLGQISNYVSAFVLGTEILAGNVRVLFSSLGVCMGFALGYMMLPLIAYFLRDWKYLLVALSVPGIIYLPTWWFIPESPRWLLTQGRSEEAKAILRRAAKKNKVEVPQNLFEDYNYAGPETETKTDNTQTKERYNVFYLLRSTNIRNTTVTLCLVWFTVSIGYFGLSLNTSRLHANPFLSCFIAAAIEVPSYISSWLALRYLPRQVSVIFVLLLGGVSLYLVQVVPQGLSSLAIALEMLGKYGLTACTALMFVYTAELYPTALRNTATGVCATLSRVGSCIAPFVFELSVYLQYLPYILLGTLAVVSAFATFFLPESFGRPLPQTIEQMHKRERMKCPFITRKELSKSVVLHESQF